MEQDWLDWLLLLLLPIIGVLYVVGTPLLVWRLGKVLRQRYANQVMLYWLSGVGLMVAPPVVLLGGLALLALTQFQGQCGGWMDSTPVACSVGQYLQEQLFWAGMVAGVPIFIVLVATQLILLAYWMMQPPAQSPASGS
jgi:hypothetical protein